MGYLLVRHRLRAMWWCGIKSGHRGRKVKCKNIKRLFWQSPDRNRSEPRLDSLRLPAAVGDFSNPSNVKINADKRIVSKLKVSGM